MRAHAVVIGIDHYTVHPEWDLTGATRDAVNFARWVLAYGGVAPADLTLLLSPPVGEQAPADLQSDAADWQTIVDTLDAYEARKAKGADRFWFYYAGHGLAAPGEGPSAGPLIVPSNAKSLEFYLKHWRISMELFRESMQDVEPKEQFFFIDACRDVLDVQEKKTLTQRIYWDPRGINDSSLATQVVFLATTVGRKAKELRGQGIFSRVLLAALKGIGPILGEPPDSKAGRLSLYFNSLNTFVRDATMRELADVPDIDDDERRESVPYATIGRTIGDVEIAQFDVKQLPKIKIAAVVKPEAALPSARLEFVEWSNNTARDEPVADPPPVEPPLQQQQTFELRGGKHKVRVEAPGYEPLTRPLLVFEEKSFLLKLTAEKPGLGLEAFSLPRAASRAPNIGNLIAESPDRLTRLTVLDGGGKAHAHGVGRLDVKLPPGRYVVRGELSGVPTKEQAIVVERGGSSDVKVDIGNGNYIDPSENLGDIANARFGSILAYAAWAARWPPEYGFHRLRAMGVDPLPTVHKHDSAAQVLIGDAMGDARFLAACKVQLQAGDDRADVALTALPTQPARQGALLLPPGPLRVRVEMPGFVATTFALTLLPNLVTVLIVAREKNGGVEIQQHFNPVDPTMKVAPGFQKPRYDDVRVVEIGARALENREPLADNDYERLLGAKGTNPMLGLIAGYRSLNTPHAKDFKGIPLRNMLNAFPELPDVHVLAGLYEKKKRDAHFRRAMKAGTPVFAEGFWTLFDWLTQQALKKSAAPPLLRQELTAGMVWTSFLDPAPQKTAGEVRIVTSTGRTSLATISDDRGITGAARSVGRIAANDGSYIATAFLLGPRIAVVPVHVATAFASVDAKGRWSINKPTTIHFDLADKKSVRHVARVLRTVRPRGNAIPGGTFDRDFLDICWPVLLQLDDDAPVPPLTLAKAQADDGDRVAVIGFPIDTPTAATAGFARHFMGASGEKHVMSGVVIRPAGNTWTFDHNCFTAPGTSGSPIVDHAGRVLGMHVAALPSSEGYKVGSGLVLTKFDAKTLA